MSDAYRLCCRDGRVAVYSIDTNIYFDWWTRRYPNDVFPSVRKCIEALVGDGKWIAAEQVFEEIQALGVPLLRNWARANRAQFIPLDAALLAEADAISRAYPDIIDPDATQEEADRHVIALAKHKGWTVVSHETPAISKRYSSGRLYVPDVCGLLKVPCIDLLELMKREKWSF